MTTTLVRSITEAMRHVRRGEAVHAEGVGGMLRMRKHENDFWECEFLRLGVVVAAAHFCPGRTADVHDWLRTFFPLLIGKDPRGDHRRNAGGRVSYEGRRRRRRRGADGDRPKWRR
jgi:hypothetical protein